jgi:hypothetical protein
MELEARPGQPLLDVRRIYVQPAAAALSRGRQVLDRWPAAERVEVGLRRALHRQRLRDGVRLLLRPAAQGLLQPGHRLRQHRADHRLPTAKASFATKHVNRELLDWDPQGRKRIRFSLMPDDDSRLLDVRTSRIADRTAAIDDFVAAGYEVHVNLSPVVVRGGWLAAWAELLDALAAGTGEEFKQQAAAEVIFLTHNEQLHQVNLDWHPKAEELLWRPDLQQPKRSQTGGRNVRYRTGLKGSYVAQLSELLAERTPWLRIRYAF